jgi:hypothetical protein
MIGTILFGLFHFLGWINTQYDAVLLCFLISLDSIAFFQGLKLTKKK